MAKLTRQDVEKQIQDSQDPTVFIVPDDITEIRENAFRGCSILKEIKLPGNIESIAYETFWGCTALEQITLPKGL